MSLPPVQINIKRRRQDDPVELLCAIKTFQLTTSEHYADGDVDLETDRSQSKRRVTEFYFKRLGGDGIKLACPAPQSTELVHRIYGAAKTRAASDIPIVRATSPGAEIRDEAARRAAQEQLRSRFQSTKDPSKLPPSSPTASNTKRHTGVISQGIGRSIAPLRQFRLSHSSRTSQSSYPSGVRKKKNLRGGWHANETEKVALLEEISKLQDRSEAPPGSSLQGKNVQATAELNGVHKNSTISSSATRDSSGQSMHEHPSTWDYDSDQLAQDLADFALEVSQDPKEEKQARNNTEVPADPTADLDDRDMISEDFAYDTYIRIPIDDDGDAANTTNKVGVIVIEDEDQALWQTYAEGGSDSEWDEEDPDSNAEDHPGNDYPDEELDSEDDDDSSSGGHGGGFSSYKHRRSAYPNNEEEEYDLDRSWSDSE